MEKEGSWGGGEVDEGEKKSLKVEGRSGGREGVKGYRWRR